uniref:major outer membrane protein n=1 Tax=Campylobacter concisus TaxID=199 RepID=UPI00112FBC5D
MLGTGLKVLNSDVPGLTLAALWMDSLEEDGDIHTLDHGVADHDLFGAAAIGSFDPVSFQVWYAKLMDVTDLMAAQVNLDFAANDDMKFGFVGQVSATKFDSNFLPDAVDDGLFFGVELNTELYGFDAAAGYVDYSADKGKLSLASFEDTGALLTAGEQIAYGFGDY